MSGSCALVEQIFGQFSYTESPINSHPPYASTTVAVAVVVVVVVDVVADAVADVAVVAAVWEEKI